MWRVFSCRDCRLLPVSVAQQFAQRHALVGFDHRVSFPPPYGNGQPHRRLAELPDEERRPLCGLALEEVVTAYGDPVDRETATLLHFLDATTKRNLVLTFGGGVNEVQRELIAMFGLGLPKVPR